MVKGFSFREKSERNVLHSNGGSICKADALIIFYSLARKVCKDGTLGEAVISVSTHISLFLASPYHSQISHHNNDLSSHQSPFQVAHSPTYIAAV